MAMLVWYRLWKVLILQLYWALDLKGCASSRFANDFWLYLYLENIPLFVVHNALTFFVLRILFEMSKKLIMKQWEIWIE